MVRAGMVRRRVVLAAFLSLVLARVPAWPGDTAHAAVYAKDVEFLLEELEKKAGHFFKVKGIDWKAVAKQFRAEVKGVKSDAEHLKLCARLVDAGVRSAGETVAGMFKEDARAYTIGDTPTHGMSSSKETLAVPSGLFSVRFSVQSNKGRFNAGRGIEGVGVSPHEVVPYDPAELARGVDTEIRRAEELVRDGFPKGAMRYEPPRNR